MKQQIPTTWICDVWKDTIYLCAVFLENSNLGSQLVVKAKRSRVRQLRQRCENGWRWSRDRRWSQRQRRKEKPDTHRGAERQTLWRLVSPASCSLTLDVITHWVMMEWTQTVAVVVMADPGNAAENGQSWGLLYNAAQTHTDCCCLPRCVKFSLQIMQVHSHLYDFLVLLTKQLILQDTFNHRAPHLPHNYSQFKFINNQC